MRKYHGTLIHQTRTETGVIEVVQDRIGRSLHFGTSARQSAMHVADPTALALAYTRAMMTALVFCPEPRNALVLGLGGGSLAKFLLQHYPECQVDAVEYSPEVVTLARRYFALPEDTRLNIHIGDAAGFLPQAHAEYDLILVDLYDVDGLAPAVMEPAFLDACHAHLTPRGVLSVNLWGSDQKTCRHMLNALRARHDNQVLRLPAEGTTNLILLALRQALPRNPWPTLRLCAQELAARTGMEFPRYVGELRRCNATPLARLIQQIGG